MQKKLSALAQCATEVARIAHKLRADDTGDHEELHRAMMEYRAAAVAYLAHPSVGDYVRADALRYHGEARQAVERIADLIDLLNQEE